MNARDIIIYLTVKNKGDWSATMEDIRNKVHVETEEVEKVANRYPHAITIMDEAYPKALRKAPKIPFVVFLNEEIDLSKDNIAFIIDNGKEPSEYESEQRWAVKKELVNEDKVVLEKNKGTLGFIGRIGKKQFRLSFFPRNAKKTALNEAASYIYAGALSRYVYVISALPHCPSLIGLSSALASGHNVDYYALPHENFSGGDICNDLIYDGALPLIPGKALLG